MDTFTSESFWQTTWTIIAFVFFVVVVVWAWSGKRKTDFDRASRMALDDDKAVSDEQRRDT